MEVVADQHTVMVLPVTVMVAVQAAPPEKAVWAALVFLGKEIAVHRTLADIQLAAVVVVVANHPLAKTVDLPVG